MGCQGVMVCLDIFKKYIGFLKNEVQMGENLNDHFVDRRLNLIFKLKPNIFGVFFFQI